MSGMSGAGVLFVVLNKLLRSLISVNLGFQHAGISKGKLNHDENCLLCESEH